MYYILGYKEGCAPCKRLKEFMATNTLSYVFVDAKGERSEFLSRLKKEVGKLPKEKRVVPALFEETTEGLALVDTGFDNLEPLLTEKHKID